MSSKSLPGFQGWLSSEIETETPKFSGYNPTAPVSLGCLTWPWCYGMWTPQKAHLWTTHGMGNPTCFNTLQAEKFLVKQGVEHCAADCKSHRNWTYLSFTADSQLGVGPVWCWNSTWTHSLFELQYLSQHEALREKKSIAWSPHQFRN